MSKKGDSRRKPKRLAIEVTECFAPRLSQFCIRSMHHSNSLSSICTLGTKGVALCCQNSTLECCVDRPNKWFHVSSSHTGHFPSARESNSQNMY